MFHLTGLIVPRPLAAECSYGGETDQAVWLQIAAVNIVGTYETRTEARSPDVASEPSLHAAVN